MQKLDKQRCHGCGATDLKGSLTTTYLIFNDPLFNIREPLTVCKTCEQLPVGELIQKIAKFYET